LFLIKFHCASVFERASFVWSASVGEREDLFVIVYSPLCFPPRVEDHNNIQRLPVGTGKHKLMTTIMSHVHKKRAK